MDLADAQDCGTDLGASLRSQVLAALRTAQLQTSVDAFDLYTGGRLLHDDSLVTRAAAALDSGSGSASHSR